MNNIFFISHLNNNSNYNQDATIKKDLKGWCEYFENKIIIVDPDGWREHYSKSILEPITFREFVTRSVMSTTKGHCDLPLEFKKVVDNLTQDDFKSIRNN